MRIAPLLPHVLFALALGVSGCQSASAPAADGRPRASQAAVDAWVDDALSANRFIAEGRRLWEQDTEQKTGHAYKESGIKLIDRGDLRLGIREMMKALYLAETVKDTMLAANCARWLAFGYSFAGRFAHAAYWADEALAYVRAAGRSITPGRRGEVVAPALKIKGDVAMHDGDVGGAVRYYEDALGERVPFMERSILTALASAEMARQDYARARAFLDQADAGARETARTLIRRARGQLLLREGRVDEALAAFEAAARPVLGNTYEQVWAEYGVGQAKERQGDRDGALGAYRRAVKASEGLRNEFRSEEYRSGFYADVETIFDAAIDLAFDLGHVQEALDLSEASRARSLLDMVRGRIRFAEGTAAFAEAAPVSAPSAALARRLPDGVAVVVYHALPGRTLAWAVRATGVEGVALGPGRDALDRAVRELRHQVTRRSSSSAAGPLYEALIAPLGLRGDETAIFVPHKALHYLPFAALRGPRGWLVEERQVASAPSVSTLTAIAERRASTLEPILALGNPDVGDPALALPGAEREVQAIRTLYPAAEVYTGREATKAALVRQAPASTVVHVAAHATVDEIDPLYSRLRLARSDERSSADLEAYEVYRLSLTRTRFVILSGCDTGMGRVSQGDEFFGFKRVFLGAGARTLMITLWPIADESTSRLMRTFYRGLAAAPAAEALRRAQLEQLRSADYGDPVFWAPFQLVGDWR